MLNLVRRFKSFLLFFTILSSSAVFSATTDFAVFRFKGRVYFDSDISQNIASFKSLRCLAGKPRLQRFFGLDSMDLARLSVKNQRNVVKAQVKLLYHILNNISVVDELINKATFSKCTKNEVKKLSEEEKNVLTMELYLRSLKKEVSLKLLFGELSRTYLHFDMKRERTKELWK